MDFIKSPIRLMIIEDEEFDVRRIKNTITPYEDSFQIKAIVSNGKAAISFIEENPGEIDVVITDFQISGGLMGENLIKKIKSIYSPIQVIVITKMTINITDFNFAANLIKSGAIWYCTKYPGDIENFIYQPTDFVMNIFNAFQKKMLEEKQLKSTSKLTQNIENILIQKMLLGNSPQIEAIKQEIDLASSNDLHVLIAGSSGTGKELIANNIHYKSYRKYENFITINCGSLPEQLIESELFGFVKGSFTGADSNKAGLFELADKGTLFLDEVTELPHSAQVKLLRVLQEGELEKIGRTGKVKVDVRVIAATNRDIMEEIKAKRFREDLYYRLNVLQIRVPQLKEREGDIWYLFNFFMTNFSADMNKPKPAVTEAAKNLIEKYPWQGNVRELKNIVQRLLLTTDTVISEAMIAKLLDIDLTANTAVSANENSSQNNVEEILPWREKELEFRKQYFSFVRTNSSSDADAAKKLGLAPPNFHRMCKEIGLK